MNHSKLANDVQVLQVVHQRQWVLLGKCHQSPVGPRTLTQLLQELIVGFRAVTTEVHQHLGERVVGKHLCHLQDVVDGGHKAVHCTACPAVLHWLGGHAFIDDAVGKHGLVISSHNEGAPPGKVLRVTLLPHCGQTCDDAAQYKTHVFQGCVIGFAVPPRESVKNLAHRAHKLARMGHHRNMYLQRNQHKKKCVSTRQWGESHTSNKELTRMKPLSESPPSNPRIVRRFSWVSTSSA